MTSGSDSMVFVVDDDLSVRRALTSLLESVGMTVATCASAKEFLASPRPDVPSCLVLDVRMPGQNGLDFQTQLARDGVAIPIVFISGHGDIPMSVRAMKAGAVEFLTKPFREQELLDAIDQALRQDAARRTEAAQTAGLRAAFASLSPGETAVVTGLVQGRTNRQIADDLSLSEITIKVRRGRLMRKLGFGSLAELIRAALTIGWA